MALTKKEHMLIDKIVHTAVPMITALVDERLKDFATIEQMREAISVALDLRRSDLQGFATVAMVRDEIAEIMDVEIARLRLAEIAAHPDRLVRGEELDTRLSSMNLPPRPLGEVWPQGMTDERARMIDRDKAYVATIDSLEQVISKQRQTIGTQSLSITKQGEKIESLNKQGELLEAQLALTLEAYDKLALECDEARRQHKEAVADGGVAWDKCENYRKLILRCKAVVGKRLGKLPMGPTCERMETVWEDLVIFD